jgi:ribonuclease P/MRP protein subunit POP7
MATNPSTAATAAPPPTTTTTTTTTLKNLTFEKKNTHLLHIPSQPNAPKYRIEKRPIPRAPVASPYAGSTVPKIVYVSSKTPFMSAVKRVQKLLRFAERRAMTPLIGKRRHSHHHHQQQHRAGGKGDVLEKCQQRLREDKVLVKATGRAIEKALSVGKWFEEGKGGGGEEYEVLVRTGSVCVVDDIVEEDGEDHEDNDEEEKEEAKGDIDPDITMTNATDNTNEDPSTNKEEAEEKGEKEESKNQRRRRRKRERIREQRLKAFVDEDGETPESRTRWVNMVEIAINMK